MRSCLPVALLLALLLGMVLPAVEPPPVVSPRGTAPSTAPVAGVPALANPPATTVTAQDPGRNEVANPPGVTLRLDPGQGRAGMSQAIRLLIIITLLAVAPGFLMMMTSFTRIIIVLGFVRRALGTQTLPPNQVLLGLTLFLTFFTMAPTLRRVQKEALDPYMKEQIHEGQALERAEGAVRDFMLKHTRKTDLALFIRLAGEERPRTAAEVSFITLVPAFATSELKTAFQMGFIIFLPFLVIDLVIAAVLMALGMMMLPPVIISLPFKILLFVLVDGWALLLQGLAASCA